MRPPTFVELRWADLLPRAGAARWKHLPGVEQVRLTHSGRAALYQYLAAVRRAGVLEPRRNVVLLPAFHCPTVVDPVLHAGFECRFFAISEDLSIDQDDFLAKLGDEVAAALFIRYFGFGGLDTELVAACRNMGARVIEDCSHSFLNTNPLRLASSGADATTYSLYKLIPGKAGGGVLLNDPVVAATWRPPVQPPWSDTRARMSTLSGELTSAGRASVLRALGRPQAPAKVSAPVPQRSAAEAYPYVADESLWALPVTSRWVLGNADLAAVAGSRRRNFSILANEIEPNASMRPIADQLDESTCPWGFPVLLASRRDRDYQLWNRGVPLFTFGEVLHPKLIEMHAAEGRMLNSAQHLSEQLLVLSVHQGLDDATMRTTAQTVNSFLRGS